MILKLGLTSVKPVDLFNKQDVHFSKLHDLISMQLNSLILIALEMRSYHLKFNYQIIEIYVLEGYLKAKIELYEIADSFEQDNDTLGITRKIVTPDFVALSKIFKLNLSCSFIGNKEGHRERYISQLENLNGYDFMVDYLTFSDGKRELGISDEDLTEYNFSLRKDTSF